MPRFLRTFLIHWTCWMTGWTLIAGMMWAVTGSMMWAGAMTSASAVLVLVVAALLKDRLIPNGW